MSITMSITVAMARRIHRMRRAGLSDERIAQMVGRPVAALPKIVATGRCRPVSSDGSSQPLRFRSVPSRTVRDSTGAPVSVPYLAFLVRSSHEG